VFMEITPASGDEHAASPDASVVPDRSLVERHLYEEALQPWLAESAAQREHESQTVKEHVELSLNELIHRQQLQLSDFLSRQIEGQTVAGLDGIISQASQHLDELTNRLDRRLSEIEMERHCTIADVSLIGRALVLPHPERDKPTFRPMVRDDEIERIAVRVATEFEEARGCVVESVESENRGFDLISRKPHPEDPQTSVEVRFIEVKGRAEVGDVFLTTNEYRAAERLAADYWLYAVFNCGSEPQLNTFRNPAQLDWKPIVKVEHYVAKAADIRTGAHD